MKFTKGKLIYMNTNILSPTNSIIQMGHNIQVGDSQEFLEAILRVKTLFSLARGVVIRHRSAPLFKQAFMRLFFHATRDEQVNCILSSGMSLRYASLIHEMLQHVTLDREEWKRLAMMLCNLPSNQAVNNNRIATKILSSALQSKLISADELFAALVPNYASFEHPDLCCLVVHYMHTLPTDVQKQWAFDNLDDEIVSIINGQSYIHGEPLEEEQEEVSAPPRLRTTTIMQLISHCIMLIMEELCKDKSVKSPNLFIALREHFPSIFVFISSLTNTVAIGIEDLIDPQLHILENCNEAVIGADTPQRASDIIRRLLGSKRFMAAKWLLQHVPFDDGLLLKGIDTYNNYNLELIGHQTGILITRDIEEPPSGILLWRHIFDIRAAAHNILRLPELLLKGERLLIQEYGKMCVWPAQRTLEDGRVFALWEGILRALYLVNKQTSTRFCESTWKIVCHYAIPSLEGDISLLIK